jgi:hypothetical protein
VVNVEQLKNSVNRMSVDVVREAVLELRLDGLVTEGKTPFNKLHFNTCFAEIEALFQRAGRQTGHQNSGKSPGGTGHVAPTGLCQ